jgi:hypothetical protein
MVLNLNAEMLSSISKCKKAVVCLIEKIHVLSRLHEAQVKYETGGYEFSIKELTMHIKEGIFK